MEFRDNSESLNIFFQPTRFYNLPNMTSGTSQRLLLGWSRLTYRLVMVVQVQDQEVPFFSLGERGHISLDLGNVIIVYN